MNPWRDDFTYYYYSGTSLVAASLDAVPMDIEDYATIGDAVSYVVKLGCAGFSQHVIKSPFHTLCLAVLRAAVEKYGTVVPEILRGVRDDRAEADHKILFGTTELEVAQQYGRVKVYRNVKGLVYRAYSAVSVQTGDYDKVDEEIIFFPEYLN